MLKDYCPGYYEVVSGGVVQVRENVMMMMMMVMMMMIMVVAVVVVVVVGVEPSIIYVMD